MSSDNALIIALATKSLPKEYQKKAIYISTFLAAVMRLLLVIVSVYILRFAGVQYLGGVLLLYITRLFFR